VLSANQSQPTDAREALHKLCEHYWKPVYVYIRTCQHDQSQAEDLTQEFFAGILEKGRLGDANPSKGRFRAYLLGAVKHFLSDDHDRDEAKKRGGGLTIISFDAATIEHDLLADNSVQPDALFDRKWAVSVLDRALQRLKESHDGEGKRELYRLLKPHLVGDRSGKSYAEIGTALGMKEGSVKSAVHRLRKDYGRLLKDEVRQCACRVGGGLPSSRTRFVFSVCRLVSRRCHAISSILGCPTRPSQNRACAIYAHGSSHCHSRAIITGQSVPLAWAVQTGSHGCGVAAVGIAFPSG